MLQVVSASLSKRCAPQTLKSLLLYSILETVNGTAEARIMTPV
jgi:hypothetical protein